MSVDVLSILDLILFGGLAGFLLTVFALVALPLMRSQSSSARHSLLLVVVSGAIFAPLCILLLPKWHVLPRFEPTEYWAAQNPDAFATNNRLSNQERHSPEAADTRDLVAAPADDQVLQTAASDHPTQASLPLNETDLPAASATPTEAPATISDLETRSSLSLGHCLAVIWLCFTTLLLARLARAGIALKRLERTCTCIAHSHDGEIALFLDNLGINPHSKPAESLIQVAEESIRAARVRRPTSVLIGEDLDIPQVWGLWHHKLTLPAAAYTWDSEKLRSVLMHELAHIRRFDSWAMLTAQISCAMHWFNPFMWIVVHRMHIERERACDDLVLDQGIVASRYAEHLLQIVTPHQSLARPASGLAMASGSDLGKRLEAILCTQRNRMRTSIRSAAVFTLIVTLVALPPIVLRGATIAAPSPETALTVTTWQSEAKEDDEENAASEDTEKKLHWSEPVDGLQAALLVRKKENDVVDLFLSVKNMSDKSIHLDDSGSSHEYSVYVRHDDRIVQAISTDKSRFGDVIIGAGESIELPFFAEDSPIGPLLAQGFLLNPKWTLSAAFDLQPEEPKNWRGKLKVPATTSRQAAVGALPARGEKLDPAVEQQLSWGAPVEGLKCAVAIRANSEGKLTLVLFVKNESNQLVRLLDNLPGRECLLSRFHGEDVLQARYSIEHPTEADVFLLSGESVALDLGRSNPEVAATLVNIADTLLKSPKMNLTATLTLPENTAKSWHGTMISGKANARATREVPLPKDKSSKELYRKWLGLKRQNDKIPGGALHTLHDATANFVKHNPTDKRTPKLKELLTEIDVSRDWEGAEAVDLLDRIAQVYDLASWALESDRFQIASAVSPGKPLPKELHDAPWGEPAANGMRVAWLLDPQKDEYRLNTPLKSRLLYHNSGKQTIFLRVNSFNQSSAHATVTKDGTETPIESTYWTTMGQISACRLKPGEYIEVFGAGIGVGKNTDREIWRNTRVGAWIDAKAGDEITFRPAPMTLSGKDGRRQGNDKTWWQEFVRSHLATYSPLPAEAAERRRILSRTVRELFDDTPTEQEVEIFWTDDSPQAFDRLAQRLAKRSGFEAVFGDLTSGTTAFRVLPVDPEAKEAPFIAKGPGQYQISSSARLVIIGRPSGIDAKLELGQGADKSVHPVDLPKRGTWAIAWKRETPFFWIGQPGKLREVRFSDPGTLAETNVSMDETASVPKRFLDALKPTIQRLNPAAASSADR